VRNVVILGSTGSIGTQALDVISSRRDQFAVVGLAAGGSDIELLARQVIEFRPSHVAVARGTAVEDLQLALYAEAQRQGYSRGDFTLPRLWAGPRAATELAAIACDVVLNAITGSAGLEPTLATLQAGTTLALANKESLVIGGRLVTEAAAPGQIVAVDSEHSAFAQALRCGARGEVRRLILTASGGPFRGRRRDELLTVTPDQAMAHPTWKMGRVITINSATLVNKGLELIEAALLYDVPLDAVTVVVHPQSVVHSMVEYYDGSTIAQCSPPDMRLPIALGLTWPDRVAGAVPACDWTTASSWTFEPLDAEAFPAVELARRAGLAAGTAPAVLNAANEECVDAFCDGRIGFLDIVDTVTAVVDEHLTGPSVDSIEGARHVTDADVTVAAVLAADAWARERARELTARG
jgi:1-deoxy-D-xylulose-5-phosphate reductoisomerase